jgi:hypothetical protein
MHDERVVGVVFNQQALHAFALDEREIGEGRAVVVR